MTVRLQRRIQLFVPSAPSLARFSAGYEHFQVVGYGSWLDLWERLPHITPDSIILVDPYESDTGTPAEELFRLLKAFPSVTVVVGLEVTAARANDVRRMIEAGISGVLNLRLDTSPQVVVWQFYDALGRPFKRRLQSVLSPYLSADGNVIIRAACEIAVLGGGAQALADVFEVTQKTLVAWCEQHKLPTTRSLQLWLRLLLAAYLLEDAGRTVQAVARAAGYSSDRALRRALGQVLGSGPSSLRREGSFGRVSQAFNDHLRKERTSSRAN